MLEFFLSKVIYSGSQISEEELRVAEDKFDESKHLAQDAMHNVLENEVCLHIFNQSTVVHSNSLLIMFSFVLPLREV